MICRVELATDLSALQAVRVRDHAQHDVLHAGCDGAGNESTGRDIASLAKKITWWQAAEIIGISDRAHATLAGALRGVWLSRSV